MCQTLCMVIRKERAAHQSFGRGSDNYRQPASYVVLNDAGIKVGIILGSSAGFMEKSQWQVCWVSPAGIPRTVKYADSFTQAKAWAEQWDGQAPEQWRTGGGQ